MKTISKTKFMQKKAPPEFSKEAIEAARTLAPTKISKKMEG